VTDPPRQTMSENGDPAARAIAALTEAANSERDFAELLCRVAAAVAANVGGTEVLLSGRSGSWEADKVRQLLHCTVGADEEHLWRHRTIPLRLNLHVADTWYDFGLAQMFETEREKAVEDTFSDDEDVAEAAGRLVDALEGLYDTDLAAYALAYAATVRQELAARGVTVDVDLVRVDEEAGPVAAEQWSALAEDLHAVARERTPLPATGQKPDWSLGSPAVVVRAAGRTYTERARATDQPASGSTSEAT